MAWEASLSLGQEQQAFLDSVDHAEVVLAILALDQDLLLTHQQLNVLAI